MEIGENKRISCERNQVSSESKELSIDSKRLSCESKRVIRLLIVICIMMFILIGYLTYIQLFQSSKLNANQYNKRNQNAEENILRGKIFDRKAVLLADSQMTKNGQKRIYPYGAAYSQVIGYNSRVYGRSLIEAAYNDELLGIEDYQKLLGLSGKEFIGKQGNNLYLTIDNKLQLLAGKLLSGKKGAIVAIQPATGEILAMLSKPDFNPNSTQLAEKWEYLVEAEDAPFLPRATKGLYAPGSTFKVVTAAAAIENGMEEITYNDKGVLKISGQEIKNAGGKAYGNIDLEKAMLVSSNVFFSKLSADMGQEAVMDICNRFGFNKNIDFDLSINQSKAPYKGMTQNDLAAVGIGQGKILVTPLHMAMIASTIANDGVMQRPFVVSKITDSNGQKVKNTEIELLSSVISVRTADKIESMMEKVVINGTGAKAKISGIRVAGKTGTAQNELTARGKNKEHAWFIGFAPVENPKIAVAVIVEYAGTSGGSTAAPIAREIISQWLKGQ